MKQGWTYKKLNEVCDKGSSNIVINKLEDNNGDYPLFGASGLVKNVDFYHQDKPYIGIVKDGAGVGRVNTYPAFSSLVGTMQYIFAKEECLLDYLKYFLVKLDLSHCVSGATIPHIYFKDYGKEKIPVPSIDIQQDIVSELNKINELIALKKSQLNDFDYLIQSIFYEMFGDPVVNDKKWEVKKLGDVCKFTQGMQVPIEEQQLSKGNGLVQFLRIIDFTQGKDAPRYVKCTSDKYLLHEREIAIVRYGTPGFVCYGKIGAIANNLFKITPNQKDLFEFEFLVHWLNTDAFQSAVKNKQYGAALQAIKFSTIQGIDIIIPSLTVQQSFATRISQIEKQKQYIEESIKDLESLLASRMQYWFD